MTKGEHIKAVWFRVDLYIINVLVVLLAGAVGAAIMNWMNSAERTLLVARFPVVRAEERAACTREFSSQINGLKSTLAAREEMDKRTAADVADMKTLMQTTNELAAYTLRFLGDRARVNDQRTAAMLKQTKEAAAAASAAQKTTATVEQKVTDVAVKTDEAASTVQAVSKKLDTAVRPALPAKPWAGAR
ncbi:hypothetical protein [Paraburkholderia largidicola]|uniref:Uncharacterized protein n=1 Tax=Paraburkholderia largidicola TaxID=3014751 RepID=A0A7I8BJ00_9BURK|nr:hypothetical protein [Paraburkholderia sp. PGU16]BCF88657.1 hypothetical protein PPGU16_17240 [Paraburkholderia sp. PGU16]